MERELPLTVEMVVFPEVWERDHLLCSVGFMAADGVSFYPLAQEPTNMVWAYRSMN